MTHAQPTCYTALPEDSPPGPRHNLGAPESAKMFVILTTTPAIAVLLLIRVALCENRPPGSTH